MQSKEMTDIYSTREPQLAFHQRISFCLDIHNMSVKVRPPHTSAMRRCLGSEDFASSLWWAFPQGEPHSDSVQAPVWTWPQALGLPPTSALYGRLPAWFRESWIGGSLRLQHLAGSKLFEA